MLEQLWGSIWVFFHSHVIKFHYNDMTWGSWCLRSLATQLSVKQLVHANTKNQSAVLLSLCEGNLEMLSMSLYDNACQLLISVTLSYLDHGEAKFAWTCRIYWILVWEKIYNFWLVEVDFIGMIKYAWQNVHFQTIYQCFEGCISLNKVY